MPTPNSTQSCPEPVHADRVDPDTIRRELSEGLLAPRASIPPKFFYDALGSRLFEAICELPEYYPTRTEAAIFDVHLADIAQAAGAHMTLIDLGAGNCAKAERLLPALRPNQYVPVDISEEFMGEAVTRVRDRFPDLDIVGVAQDFSGKLELPDTVRRAQRLFFYPGSSVGNFTPPQAVAFLRGLRDNCDADGGLLIGVDLIKEKEILNAAYDDALGVTASFNLNLLLHLNRLLQADFNLRDWRHRAFFNSRESRIEMHLEAGRDLTVIWKDGQRRFAKGERIHTENSYKYTREAFVALLEQAGFRAQRIWTDARCWFMVCHARAG